MISKKRYSFLLITVLLVVLILWGPLTASSQDTLKISTTQTTAPTVVFLARADNPIDALAASSLAGSMGAAVLLTPQTSLSPITRQALINIHPDVVVLAGGTGALSQAVEDAVLAIPLPTLRVAGANRYETAVSLSALAADFSIGRPLLTDAAVSGDAELTGTLFSSGLRAHNSELGIAVGGFNNGTTENIQSSFWMPGGLFAGRNGVIGITNQISGIGVVGLDMINSPSSKAGWFGGNVFIDGNLNVNGTVTKSAGSFKIDHPLDPQNKYLYHSFVESPDMMNVYNGNVILDSSGKAWVDLPEWFEALNMDYRYQLTAIGAPGPNLHIASKIADNRFLIGGGSPGMEVSWQVTGIRNDPYAQQNRIPVEQDKDANEQGTYLYPELYGQPESLRLTGQP